MLTSQDIKKLSSLLDGKLDSRFELVATKSEVKELKEDVQSLRETIQELVVAVVRKKQEFSCLNFRSPLSLNTNC